MPRKTTKTTTDKKHTAVPKAMPAAKPTPATPAMQPTVAAAPVVATPAVATPAAAKPAAAKPVQPAAPSPEVLAAISALNDFDADAARDAATRLGTLGHAAAVEPLIDVVRNSNNYFHSVVRAAAATSLGQLKDARAADALLHAIHDPAAEPSAEAIYALAALGEKRAFAALVEVVRNRDGFYLSFVRRAAVLAIARLGGEQAKAELTRIASDASEDAVIRETAENAIRPA